MPHRPPPGHPWQAVAPTELVGIGKLVGLGPIWQLTYTACGHVQQLARVGLEDLDGAVADIRRHYALCLLCARRSRWTAPSGDLTAEARPRRTQSVVLAS